MDKQNEANTTVRSKDEVMSLVNNNNLNKIEGIIVMEKCQRGKDK